MSAFIEITLSSGAEEHYQIQRKLIAVDNIVAAEPVPSLGCCIIEYQWGGAREAILTTDSYESVVRRIRDSGSGIRA